MLTVKRNLPGETRDAFIPLRLMRGESAVIMELRTSKDGFSTPRIKAYAFSVSEITEVQEFLSLVKLYLKCPERNAD